MPGSKYLKTSAEEYLAGDSLDSVVPKKILEVWDRGAIRQRLAERTQRARIVREQAQQLQTSIEALIAETNALGIDGVKIFDPVDEALSKALGQLVSFVPDSRSKRTRGHAPNLPLGLALARGLKLGKEWTYVAAVLSLAGRMTDAKGASLPFARVYDAVGKRYNSVDFRSERAQIELLLRNQLK